MIEYVVIGIPSIVAATMIGFFAATDPIEATIERVTVAPIFEDAGYQSHRVEAMLHARIERIGQTSGSWAGDKRVRVANMDSGVELLANSMFSFGEFVESSLRVLNVINYVVDVYYGPAPGKFVATVHFRDALTGSHQSDRDFEIETSPGDKTLTPKIVEDLTELVADHIMQTAEPYIYSADLYMQTKESGEELLDVFYFIDSHMELARSWEMPWMHNLRGLVAAELGVYAYAIREYSVAIEHDHRFGAPYINWGRLWYDLGEYEKAAELIRKGLRYDSHAVGHLYLAEALIALGDLDEALRELRIASTIERHFARVYRVTGDVLRLKGDEHAARAADRAADRALAREQHQTRFAPF